MRIHKLYQCFAAAVLLFLPVACDNTDYSEKSPFDNSAYLNVAASKNTEAFTFNRKVTSQTKTFAVKLSYPAGDDVKVSLKVDASLTSEYNAKNDTHYEVLPETYYQLLKTEVVLPAGKTTSEEVGIKFSKLDELEIDVTYLCPLSIGGADGVGVMDGSRTMYYLVRRSSAITTAMNLKNIYVAVPGFDKGSSTSDVVNNLSAVTMEAIIRVNSFQQEISSIMGIEQYFLMRIGDKEFPNRQLQTQTTFGKFPEINNQKLLLAGEWYHVALTWDIATATIAFYVNGQLQSISTSHGKSDLTSISLGDKLPDDEFGNGGDFNFYFDGEICEARIWNVARTQEQIYQNMYEISNPTTEPALCAYWKFDEGTGTVVADRTGHGNDAKVVPYWKGSDHLEMYSKTDAELWPSGIEVPKVNQE